jgi:Tfp pilus assembly protein PilZ
VTTGASDVVVRVKFVTRRQLKQAWVRDLSKNTLFVRTDLPLAPGTRVLLVLELPDEETVEVPGDVASVVPLDSATPTNPAGMAVTMRNFDGGKRSRIEEFLRRHRALDPGGETQRLRIIPDGSSRPPPAMELLVRALRRLLWLSGDAAKLADVDHYQVLGLPATAHSDEIREACTVLRVLLDPSSPPEGLHDRLTPAQHERLGALHAWIGEIEKTLTDPARRAKYDAEAFGVVR